MQIDAVKKFIQTESLPLVVEFNHDTAQKIFGGDIKSHLLMFLSQSASNYEELLKSAKSVAGPFRDRVSRIWAVNPTKQLNTILNVLTIFVCYFSIIVKPSSLSRPQISGTSLTGFNSQKKGFLLDLENLTHTYFQCCSSELKFRFMYYFNKEKRQTQ